ncbi:hypothetical protein A9Q81_14885 [Gammaproteobacteria bacterium 42_54_T18]|nr:hypothetical protein A9Q81_14885 [Gammaproteobacteria bacterium 42_54_T18]
MTFVVAAVLFLGFYYYGKRQDEPVSPLESNITKNQSDQQTPDDQVPILSMKIDDAVMQSVDVPEHEIIDRLLANLSDEERAVLELQVLQTSVSKRVNHLSPGSMSEEDVLDLFEDIDYLDQNAVFLGKEAEQLKIYVKTEISY